MSQSNLYVIDGKWWKEHISPIYARMLITELPDSADMLGEADAAIIIGDISTLRPSNIPCQLMSLKEGRSLLPEELMVISLSMYNGGSHDDRNGSSCHTDVTIRAHIR